VSLSDSAAEILSHSGALGLELNGLNELSDAAAESLSKFEGGLHLTGLTSLSDAAAEALAQYSSPYDGVYIDLDVLPESAAKILRGGDYVEQTSRPSLAEEDG